MSTQALRRTPYDPSGESRTRNPGTRWTRPEIDALLRVSEAAALNPELSEVLGAIAMEACGVTGADAANIVLAQPGGTLRLGATWALSQDYVRFLATLTSDSGWMARLAVDKLEPAAVDDLRQAPRATDEAAKLRRRMALREGYLAFLSVPLVTGRRACGALNLYRKHAGPWPPDEVDLLALFAQHAASSIDSTRLIDSQGRQLEALARLVNVLRDQTHEYANRLQAISGLLALGEVREAERFLAQLITLHHANYASVVERVHHPILAALLLAQIGVAAQRGVEVKLHGRTRLAGLPASTGSAEAVTIVANMIENAVDAVSGMPAERRRATIRINGGERGVRIVVRDWGDGTTSVATVTDAVASARGTVEVQRLEPGARVCVTVPRH